MGSLATPSAPSRSVPQNRAADPSLPRRSKSSFRPAVQSWHQTLDGRTQSQQVHSACDMKFSFGQLDFYSPQGRSRPRILHVSCWGQRPVGNLHGKKARPSAVPPTSLPIFLPPFENQVGVQRVLLRDLPYGHAGLQRFEDDPLLLLDRPAAVPS